MKQIITDGATYQGEDGDDNVAVFLIDGELRWVENYDLLAEEEKPTFPGHKPFIVCHASEVDSSDTDIPLNKENN
ncbi:hypothetical protein DLE01_03060 [Streptomyces sp. FT05W]|nr:hypothetical protein [Streptomyces sp. FT05W]PWS52743.1 hypothetical protein DLE01_03060 [Streptomyces sp. FT05W]